MSQNAKNADICLANAVILSLLPATLPFQELPSAVKSQRLLELQQRKDSYKWDKSKNFEEVPGHLQAATYKDIPRDSQFSNETRESIDESRKNVTRKLGLAHLLTLFESWDNLDDFQKILKHSYGGVPRIVEDDRWKTDTVFGWMFLNGCNPNVLERCEILPDNFPVTEEMVQPALDRGLTFEQECKVRKGFHLQQNSPNSIEQRPLLLLLG